MVLGWIEVAKGRGDQEAAMLRLDCVSSVTSLLIPHKHGHELLVFA